MEPLQTLVPSSVSVPRLLSRSISSSGCKSNSMLSRSGRENTPPIPPNIQIDRLSSPSVPKKILKKRGAPTAPEHPSFVGPKDELAPYSDASVKVFVRIKPDKSQGKESLEVARKIASDTLSIGGRAYSFDSILDYASSQEDVFNLVGIPLVKDSLAGFNSSVISYGQSGTGKTYTMWGPPSAMVDGQCSNSSQGIVPRVLNMLFSEINKKEDSSDVVQTNYQCRCSFLEIYNEQINDLLDPTLRNLVIRGDAKNTVQVENLNEVYVNTFEEVTQLLVKGLSNRKVGSTSVNSKSSRSHIIFTCVVESWCKGSSSTVFTSSKTSRISFVDLAGIDDSKLDGFGSQSIQEKRYIKHSLSNLGRLVNTLSNSSDMGDDKKVPHMDCRLTNLLQDSLGGNAKVILICTIFPDDRCKARTLSTLRFGERAKQIKNKVIINEISEDDVNGLSDQIRQLKEELIRAKSWGTNCFVGTNGHMKKYSTRESLNHLRQSLNRSLLLPSIDDEQEMDMDVDEEDVKDLCMQFNDISSSMDEQAKEAASTDSISQHVEVSVSCPLAGNSEMEEDCSKEPKPESQSNVMLAESNKLQLKSEKSLPCKQSPCIISLKNSTLLEEPVSCASPRVHNSSRKSKSLSPGFATSNNLASGDPENALINEFPLQTSLQSSKVSPIESLAASLHRGLQIIDYHQQNSSANKSLVSLSFEHLSSFSCQSGMKRAGACAQTSQEDVNTPYVCSSCKVQDEVKPSGDAIQRNIELEALCAEQAEMIKQLSSQIDQYRSAREKNLSLEQKPSEAMLSNEVHTSSVSEKEKLLNSSERDELLEEEQCLRKRLQSCTCGCTNDSLLELIRNGSTQVNGEEFENEKHRWMESESRWISLAEELRMDLESTRRLAEKRELELSHEKHCIAELDDALHRSILGHARIVEHYTDLQEKYDELLVKHRKVMEGIAEVKKAAAKVGCRGKGSSFASALAAELATSRIEREKERAHLKHENRVLKLQLRDTAEAVHAAGELLVRLREAEEAASATQEKYDRSQQEIEKVRRQMEKLKKKHAMEMATMKHYLAESRLPESALEPLYHHSSSVGVEENGTAPLLDDDMSWRSAFMASYK